MTAGPFKEISFRFVLELPGEWLVHQEVGLPRSDLHPEQLYNNDSELRAVLVWLFGCTETCVVV